MKNAPAAMQPYLTRGAYAIHPAMADYPVDNTFVYRSADKYGRNAAVRLNTTLLIYTDVHFETKAILEDAYYNMFAWAQRGQEICVGLESAGTPYQGYGADTVPYSLSARNPVVDGKTLDGIYVIPHMEERFADLKTVAGEYLQYWVEYLPEEVVNGTAADGSIPLLLLLHGGGDDPHQFADGQNFLDLAGRERLCMVAPEKNNLHTNTEDGVDFLSQSMPQLVQYMLDTYPAIDVSRVYVTGYSMGSTATCRAANGAPWLFTAAYPQNGFGATSNNPTEADIARFEGIQLPIVCSTTEYNYGKYETIDATNIGAFNAYLMLNHMDKLPEEIDYSIDPILGIKTDLYTEVTLNDDYKQHTWYQCNEDCIPMVGLNYVECINHCLYPQYADMIWNFFKHYSRNQETLEIEYDPYVR